MRRVIGGKIYNTETATLIADTTYADGRNKHTGGRATFLYTTAKGAYFACHETCWQNERDVIEPLTTEEAVALYEKLNDPNQIAFELAFPDVPIEEA